jgi:hypothetical protein
VAGLACALAFAIPSQAAAADTYVDAVNGDDANFCDTPATACETIASGVIFAGATDTVHVESGTYGGFNLPRGLSVVADDFNANNSDPRPVIAGDSANPAVNVVTEPVLQVGRIEGFTINGNFSSMQIADSITVRDNLFNEDTEATSTAFPGAANVTVSGGTATIEDNAFDDPQPIDNQIGIGVLGGSVTIDGNTFDGFREVVEAIGVLNLAITGNTITGLHQADTATPPDPPSFVDAFGIVVADSSATIADNLIHQPAVGGSPVAIFATEGDPDTAPRSNTVLRRNRVLDHGRALFVSTIAGSSSVSLEGDLFANSSAFGLQFFGVGPPAIPLTITNATIYGNDQDVELDGAAMTMNSTAIEDPIVVANSTCAISHSRGPTTSGNACQSFQTSAAPGFVNQSADDFHLLPTSPLIDSGDPTPPPGGAIDLDGDARALDGNCDGIARRDIGADERPRDCTAPQTTIDSGPSGTIAETLASFGFSSSEPGSTFACSLDGAPLGPCSGPGRTHTVAGLPEGPHIFRVAATDTGGNADATPAERGFVVDVPEQGDTEPPQTSFKKAPRKTTADRTPTFKFASTEPGAFQCRLDGKPFAACSAKTTVRAKLGRHVMAVFAIDAAGNEDRTPAKRRFKVVERD